MESDGIKEPTGSTGFDAIAGLKNPPAELSFLKRLKIEPFYLWRGKVSWRIALTVFATLLLVQIVASSITINHFEKEKLSELCEIAKAYVAAAIDDTAEPSQSPLDARDAQKIFAQSAVTGLAVYNQSYHKIAGFGEATTLKPSASADADTTLSLKDGDHYEFVLTPTDTGSSDYFTVQLSTGSIAPVILSYIHQAIFFLVLLSGFVTGVLMLALGRWLLAPIMLLRNNLLNAAKNPEKPEIQRMKKETRDEIGIAIRIANDLIRQNAHNLKRLRSQAEDKIHKLAYYDTLTGLPNRTFFIEKLEDAIKHKVAEEDRRLVVICVDIDHFKDVNDTMGHEFGDKLLEAISKRIVKAVPPDALVSRASADEFSIMTVLKPEQADSTAVIDAIFAAVAEPVSIMNEKFQVRVSVGVAHSPDDGMEARQILKNADIALNRAKEDGRDTVRYYSQDFDIAVRQRFQMLRDLRAALDENQLQLYYHPQFDLKTGQIIGAEALLRWWRPDNSKEGGAFISPAVFIPMAEEAGLIVPIGEWVLRTACASNKSWQDMGIPPFRIAVNISGIQFHRADIVHLVSDTLKQSKLDAKYLELEVTESVFMENMQTTIDILNQLHRQGVELAIDDFGTGYSSLSYLRQFPIDRLKIDQSFIRNALVNPDDRMIARTIINLGHSLNLQVMAEGVETLEHENFLKDEGCDEVQGFKYSKPIPYDKFVEYVINHNRNLAKNTKLSVVEEGKAS